MQSDVFERIGLEREKLLKRFDLDTETGRALFQKGFDRVLRREKVSEHEFYGELDRRRLYITAGPRR